MMYTFLNILTWFLILTGIVGFLLMVWAVIFFMTEGLND